MSYLPEVVQNLFNSKLDEWSTGDRHTDVVVETEGQTRRSFRHYRVLLAVLFDYFDHEFGGKAGANSPKSIVVPSDRLGATDIDLMLQSVRTNDVASNLLFYSKLNEWRTCEKYTDVDIEVEDHTFHCHRIVLAAGCDYFNILFDCGFTGSVSKTISLPADIVSAEAFEQILKFLYEGEILITSSNAFELLSACEFLSADIIDGVCVRHIERNLPVHNILSVLVHACACEKSSLVYNVTTYVSEHIEEYSDTREFKELDLDIVRRIVDLYPLSDETPIYNAIVQWVNHSHAERLEHFEALTDLIKFENRCSSAIMGRRTRQRQYLLENKSLYVDMFVTYASFNSVRATISSSLEYKISCQTTSCRPMRTRGIVSMNSRLYFLDNCCRDHGYSFYACASADDSSEKVDLNSPMSKKRLHTICGLRNANCIYLYDRYLILDLIFNNTNAYRRIPWNDWYNERLRKSVAVNAEVLDDKKIRCGLYSYNCETDKWNPMKTMRRQLEVSSMAACDATNMLYMIGGMNAETSDDQSSAAGYAQAYDSRMKTWRELPRTRYEYKSAPCAVFRGKVYVYEVDRRKCEVYDPVAGKWDITEKNPHLTAYPHYRMVPFRDQLWLFNNSYNEKHAHSVHLYSPTLDRWKHSWSLKDAVKNCKKLSQPPEIVDAFVF